jgi:hypothetical protein
MNLIKIQDELKDMPTQAIMSYANGANPEVPPYMALAELSRRKTMEQRRAEPPTQSIKEKLESEIENPQGIAQLPEAGTQPAAPPQGVPQRPPQGPPGMPPGMPQGVPQGMPQQMPQRPPGMAAGGITRIPTRSDMFHYAPGGIVAFAGEDESLVRSNENQERGDRYPPVPTPAAAGPQDLQGIAPLAAQQLRDELLGKFTPPAVQSKEEIRQAMIDKATAAGDTDKVKMLSQIPGDALIPLIKQLSQQNEEQRGGFKEGQGRMGLAALSNALIAAGEATRGRREPGFFAGTGDALGGFGKSYNASTAEDVKRLEAQKAIERTQSIEVATLQSKIDDLRAAHATGTVQDKQEAQKELKDQAYKMQALKMGTADKILAQALAQAQAQATKEHYKFMEGQSAASFAETKSQHAIANKAREDQLQLLKDTKPTVEDKALGRILQAMPARVKSLEARQKDLEFGSDEWNQIQDRIDDLYDQAYRGYGLTPPERLSKPAIATSKEKPGFLSRMFGSGSTQKAVPFDQLPK